MRLLLLLALAAAARAFEATHEWQEVPEGEGVPQGLYVRLDIENGKTYAKLLDESDGDGADMQAVAVVEAEEEPEIEVEDDRGWRDVVGGASVVHTEEDMASALLTLPPGEVELPSRERMSPEEYAAAVKKIWEHRQALLAQAAAEMTNDVDEMLALMQTAMDADLGTQTGVDTAAGALFQLEGHVEDVDQATDFALVGGMSVLVHLAGENQPAQVREPAFFCIGSAVKNIEKLQDLAVESGALPVLAAALDDAAGVPSSARRKAAYALGALLRGHPVAQQALFDSGLADVVGRLAVERGALAPKGLALAYDLLVADAERWGPVLHAEGLGLCGYLDGEIAAVDPESSLAMHLLALREEACPSPSSALQATLERWSSAANADDVLDAVEGLRRIVGSPRSPP